MKLFIRRFIAAVVHSHHAIPEVQICLINIGGQEVSTAYFVDKEAYKEWIKKL